MLNESVKQANVEDWKERCRLLVLENDELMAENVKMKAFILKIADSKKDSQRPTLMEQIAFVSVYFHHDEMINEARIIWEELE